MYVLTAAQMRDCDRRTVEQFGVSWAALMENAGSAVTAFVLHRFPRAVRITVLCGKGHNGGDGLVAARQLDLRGRRVQVVLLAKPDDLSGEPRAMFEKLPQSLQRSALIASTEQDLADDAYHQCFRNTELFLDAIFGTGFHPPLHGVAVALRDMINDYRAPVASIDLPSGWDADSTAMHAEDAFRSDAAITFTAPKLAHVFGALTHGAIVVAPIGSPEEVIFVEGSGDAANTHALRWTGASKLILNRPRPRDANKGSFGHVLVVGGSAGKSGAPAMASLGALRMGAGLVTAAVPRGIVSTVSRFAPEMMTHPMEESTSGDLSLENLDPSRMEALVRGIDVMAIGPGLGRTPDAAELARELVRRATLPVVLDADGLNAFEGHTEALKGTGRTLVLTPHPGEMARLIGCAIPDVERDRVTAAREFAIQHEATVVLKGWRTLVAHPNGEIAINTSGNPALAKGGSGDVLAGMIAAMIAQYPEHVAEAVECAVWLHGAAADLYVQAHDERTMLATDLLRQISRAIQSPVTHDGFTWLQEGLWPEEGH